MSVFPSISLADVVVFWGLPSAYHVNLGAFKDWRQPHDVDAQLLQVIDPRDDAFQIANTGAGGILEGGRVDLVH